MVDPSYIESSRWPGENHLGTTPQVLLVTIRGCIDNGDEWRWCGAPKAWRYAFAQGSHGSKKDADRSGDRAEGGMAMPRALCVVLEAGCAHAGSKDAAVALRVHSVSIERDQAEGIAPPRALCALHCCASRASEVHRSYDGAEGMAAS
jgi:hypothetical protein